MMQIMEQRSIGTLRAFVGIPRYRNQCLTIVFLPLDQTIASEYSRIQPIIKNGEIGTLRARPDFEEQSLPET